MAGTQIRPASGQASVTEQSKDEAERRKAAAQRERSKITNVNKVAGMLGGVRYFVQNQSFAYLVYKGTPMSVSEYYPELRIAVDKFHSMDEVDPAVVDFKKKALAKNKIKYGHLTPERSLADLHEELGL